MHVFIISEAQRHLFRALVQATCRQEMSPCTPDFLDISALSLSEPRLTERLAKRKRREWRWPTFPMRPLFITIWGFPKMGVPQDGWLVRENLIKMDDIGVPLKPPICCLLHVHHSSVSCKQIQKGAMVSVQLSGRTARWVWLPRNANHFDSPSSFLREKLSSTQEYLQIVWLPTTKPPFPVWSSPLRRQERKSWHNWLENVLVKRGDLLTLKEISPKHRESHRSHTIGMTSHCKLLLGTAIHPWHQRVISSYSSRLSLSNFSIQSFQNPSTPPLSTTCCGRTKQLWQTDALAGRWHKVCLNDPLKP